MSRKPYAPKPGSLADQVVQLLHKRGTSMTFSAIAEAASVPRTNVEPCLRAAIAHGTLVRVQPGEVRLGDGTTATSGVWPTTEAAPAKRPRKSGTRRKTTRAKAALPEDDNQAAPAAAPDVGPPGPVACLWDDGDIVLHGLTANADGATATITDGHARRLHAFLDRLFGPPVAQRAVYPRAPLTSPLLLESGGPQ